MNAHFMLRFKLIALVPGLVLPLLGQPRIFYSDLENGPNSGGENNRGAYVTVYGKSFGASQGTSQVTIGGGSAAAYPIWTDTKITFQLGSAAATGNIVLTTSEGTSNPLPFTVRPGKIFFVAPGGSNSNPGTVSSPWASLTQARDTMAPGDITYVRNGYAQTVDDGSGWRSCLTMNANSGTAGNPKAMVVYPGESATIGNVNGTPSGGCDSAIRTQGHGESYWTFAGFTLRGGQETFALYGSSNWRIIGNDMSCPNGNSQSACFESSLADHLYLYGNNVHDVATNLN